MIFHMFSLRKSDAFVLLNFEVGAVQKDVNLVDLVKSSRTSICLQKLASIQPRTSLSNSQKLAKNRKNIGWSRERARTPLEGGAERMPNRKDAAKESGVTLPRRFLEVLFSPYRSWMRSNAQPRAAAVALTGRGERPLAAERSC